MAVFIREADDGDGPDSAVDRGVGFAGDSAGRGGGDGDFSFFAFELVTLWKRMT